MSVSEVALANLMAPRDGSVDPARYPNETFCLYSIPSFDAGAPELLPGSSIGSAKQIVRPGDVLLSRIVPHIRRAWIVEPQAKYRIIASGEWIVFRSLRADPRYLRYFLTSNGFHRQFMATVAGVGGSLLRARPSQVAEIRVPLPHLSEQRRIAKILDKADAIRRKRKDAIALTEELLRSAFLEIFGDPVTNLKGWPVKPLGSLGELDRGRSRHRPRNDPALLGGHHPLIQTGEVANCDGVIRSYEQTYSDLGLTQSKMWPAGTLCITIAANIAKTGVLAFDACFPDSVVGFTPGPDVTTEYIQYWMSFLQPILERQAPQVAQKNINLEILRSLETPTPPSNRQRAFSRFVAQIRRTRAGMHSSIESADALFCSLASRAFRGGLAC